MQNDKNQLLVKIVNNIESYVAYLKDNNITEIVSSRLRSQGASSVADLPSRSALAEQGVASAAAKAKSDIMEDRLAGQAGEAISLCHKTTTSHESAAIPFMPAETMPRKEELKAIAASIAVCTKCPLHARRTKTVPGQGNTSPDILFIGEGPGEDEDLQGLAFVGRAGQLLTRLIVRMGFTRDEVFIANIVKCRPPNNRKPLPEEINACRPYLEAQIAVLKPKTIVLLGASALEGLIPSQLPGRTISKVRGKWLEYQNIPTMPTFHPSYLLRNQSAMWDVWNDMQEVLKRLGRPVPDKK